MIEPGSTDQTAGDFEWLPATMAEFGRPTGSPPSRISRQVAPSQTVSALAWGPENETSPILLHGGGQNAHTWDVVAALLGGGLAIDLPGHGHSSWRADRDYRPHTAAHAIASFLDSVGGASRPVVGMSLGGLTALALADLRPDLVPSLVLVDVLPGVERDALRLRRSEQGSVALIRDAKEFGSFDEILASAVAATPGRPHEVLTRGVRNNAMQLPSGRWRWRYDDLSQFIADDEQTERMWLAVAEPRPVLLVRGGRSHFVGDHYVERLQAVNPSAQIEVAPAAGHSVQSDAPLLLVDAITQFLQAA